MPEAFFKLIILTYKILNLAATLRNTPEYLYQLSLCKAHILKSCVVKLNLWMIHVVRVYLKAGALFQYFSSQNPSKVSKWNGCKGVHFLQKHFLEEVRPRNRNLLRKSSTAVILRNLFLTNWSHYQLLLTSSRWNLTIALRRQNKTFQGKWFVYLITTNKWREEEKKMI